MVILLSPFIAFIIYHLSRVLPKTLFTQKSVHLKIIGNVKGSFGALLKKGQTRYGVILVAMMVAFFAVWPFNLNIQKAMTVFFVIVMLLIVVIDCEHKLILDKLSLPLLWVGLVYHAVYGGISPSDAILGAAGGYISLRLYKVAREAMSGNEGIGQGDLKLFAAIGAWMGYQSLFSVFILSLASGLLIGIAFYSFRKELEIPFGPALFVGSLVTIALKEHAGIEITLTGFH